MPKPVLAAMSILKATFDCREFGQKTSTRALAAFDVIAAPNSLSTAMSSSIATGSSLSMWEFKSCCRRSTQSYSVWFVRISNLNACELC
jgi:hypothetical protein